MIIEDGSVEYNTDTIDVAITKDKDDRTISENDLINKFTRFAYTKYVQIRDVTAGKRCKKMSIDDVINKININYVSQYVHLNAEEINYILNYTKLYINIVR